MKRSLLWFSSKRIVSTAKLLTPSSGNVDDDFLFLICEAYRNITCWHAQLFILTIAVDLPVEETYHLEEAYTIDEKTNFIHKHLVFHLYL